MGNKELLARFCTALNVVNKTTKWRPDSTFVARYYEEMCAPWRAFHTLSRVGEHLDLLDRLKPPVESGPHLEIALFLLDSGTDEERTARRQQAVSNASNFVSGMHLVHVGKLIMAAAHRFPWEPYAADEALVADLSLSFLGSRTITDFEGEVELMQREYADTDRRKDLLRADREFYLRLCNHVLKEKRNVFHTPVFQDEFAHLVEDNLSSMFEVPEE